MSDASDATAGPPKRHWSLAALIASLSMLGPFSIDAYLPAKLGEAEILTAIEAAIAETGATGPADMGKLMGVLKPRLAGQADMGQVSALIKKKLAG